MHTNAITIYPVTLEASGTLESLQNSYCLDHFLKTFPEAMRKRLPEAEELENRNRIWMELCRIEMTAGREDENTAMELKQDLFARYYREIRNSAIWKEAEEASLPYALWKVYTACEDDIVSPDALKPEEKKLYALRSTIMKQIPGTDPVREIRILQTYPGIFDTDYIWNRDTGVLYIARKRLQSPRAFVRTLVLGRITAGYDAVYTHEIPESDRILLDEITECILKTIRQ